MTATATAEPSALVTPQRPDLRLVPAAVASWSGAWCATFASPGVAAAVAGAAGSMALVLFLSARRARCGPPALVAAAALACAAGSGLSAAARVWSIGAGPLPALAVAHATARLDIVVTADPQQLAPRVRGPGPVRTVILVRGRVERVTARGVATRVRSPVVAFADDERWLTVVPSQHVAVAGRLSEPQPHDDATALVRVHGPPGDPVAPTGIHRVADELRGGLRRAVAGLPAPERGLVPGLVVGDTAGMPPELVDDFRTAGLTHLTAVSGENVA